MSTFYVVGHHTQNWQHNAMYVGLHVPHSSGKRKRRGHHHRHKKDKEHPKEDSGADKPRMYNRELKNILVLRQDISLHC